MSWDVRVSQNTINTTFNHRAIFDVVLGTDAGLRDLHGLRGAAVSRLIRRSFVEWAGREAELAPLAPANGWGSVPAAFAFLRELLALCEAHPRASVVVF
jgi:hypothetical protein